MMIWALIGVTASTWTDPRMLMGVLLVAFLPGLRWRLVGALVVGVVLAIWMPVSANAFLARIGAPPLTGERIALNAVLVILGQLLAALLANRIASALRRHRRT